MIRTILILCSFLSLSLATIAQTGTITNISVQPRVDRSGMVDVHFNLSGSAPAYNINLEVSFDGGSNWQPILTAHLSGDVTGINPGNNKHLVWDGFASFPNEYSKQTQIKILAASGGGNGDDSYMTYCGIFGEWDDANNYCIGEYGHDIRITLDEASSSIFCDGYYKTYGYFKDDKLVALFISNGHCRASSQSFPVWPKEVLSEHCIIHGGTGNYKWRYHSSPEWQGNTVGVQCEVEIFMTDDNGGGNGQPGTGVTDIDGNFYPSVIIGNQEWMAKNLRVTRDAYGNDITRYCYDDDPDNCDHYGGLYRWYTVMNGAISSNTNPSNVQGICPTGWHVPSHDEWTQLEQYICNQLGNGNCETQFPYDNTTWRWRGTNEGNALKSCQQVFSPLGAYCTKSDHPRWNSHSTHYGTDGFGFSALPGGNSGIDGIDNYRFIGNNGYWWSSTENFSTNAWYRQLLYNYGNVYRAYYDKYLGISVRCARDN